jgi:diguanylate cyclase (GGDEF)-like protein/PAS domain S-box-containing protein
VSVLRPVQTGASAPEAPRDAVRIEREIERRSRQQAAVAELGQAALTGVEVSILLGQTCALVEAVLGVSRCAIVEACAGGWISRGAVGQHLGFDSCPDIAEQHDGLYLYAVTATNTITFSNLAADPRFNGAHLVERHGIQSGAAVLIPGRQRLFGVLVAYSAEPRTFAEDELAFLKAVSDITAAVIESARIDEARREAQQSLRQSEARFRALVEHSSDGIALINNLGRLTYLGPSTMRVLGYAEEDMIGRSILPIVHPDDAPAARVHFQKALQSSGREVRGELRLRHADGHWVWIEGVARNLLDEKSVGAVVVNYRDVTERKDAEYRLAALAYRDSLTGLPNRFLFNDRLTHAIDRAHRREGPLAVMYVDLDHFKIVNDTLGHAIGDRLLQAVARRLRKAVRIDDTIARLGGDEFALLLPDVDRAEEAGLIADKILQTIREPLHVDGHELYTTASIGIAMYPIDGEDVVTLLKHADAALYRSKEMGRNTVQLFAQSMNARYRERLELELTLRGALDREEFELHYQPIIEASTGRVTSLEALLRWRHPDQGLIAPDKFIKLAEDLRLIVPIGDWVLRRACMQLQEWRREGLPRFRIAVNISAHQIQQVSFIRTVEEVVRESGIEPGDLILEITESAAMQNLEWTLSVLDQLHDFGVQIAVDDFGTGESSLVYLKRFPIDILKMDREFLKDITVAPDDAAIVASMIALGHSLRLRVIAEGIEERKDIDLLKSQGCDGMQGYFFSVPVEANAVPALTAREWVV